MRIKNATASTETALTINVDITYKTKLEYQAEKTNTKEGDSTFSVHAQYIEIQLLHLVINEFTERINS